MFNAVVILIISSILAYCKSDSIGSGIRKCKVSDNDCQLLNLHSITEEGGNKGFPSIGIPILDPYEFKNLEFLFMGLLKVTLVEGAVKGGTTCRFSDYHLDLEKKTVFFKSLCDLFSIEVQYKCEKTDELNRLIGDIDIHGEGKATITYVKKRSSLEIPYELKKHEDGELHIVVLPDKIKDIVLGADNVSITGDGFYVGSQDISSVLVNIFNENWKVLIKSSIGDTITENAAQIFVKYINKLFAAIPLKDLIED